MNALNKYNTRFLLLLLPLIACSCSRKDIFSYEELYNGAVPISLDWQGITPDEQPDMQVHIWGTHISDAREEISKDTLFSVNPGTAPTFACSKQNTTLWYGMNRKMSDSMANSSICSRMKMVSCPNPKQYTQETPPLK